MIRTDNYELNGRAFTRTYSDAGRYVVRDGASYEEANDLTELGRTYTEGELIPVVSANPPAWDVLQGQQMKAGDEVSSLGVVYVCIKAHTAAWSKQPPNNEYWEVKANE